MPKILHILYSPESSGRAGLRLHRAFLESGLDSSILSLQPGITGDENIKYLGRKSKLLGLLEYKIQMYLTRNSDKQFGIFTYPVLGTDITNLEQVRKADVIYLHWILWGLLNIRGIKKIARLGKPVIVVMHDMWPITGGCHHSFTCTKYTAQCSECQIFRNKKKHDLSYFGFTKKVKLYSKYDNLSFVSPSKWLYNCAKQSLLTKDKPVFRIPNIIDSKFFIPFNKQFARKFFDLNVDDIVIAFGAVSVDSPYKGWAYLQESLEMLKNSQNIKNILVLIFGSGYNKLIAEAIPFRTKFLGYLKDEYSMALVYNASDILIVPSLAEVFGYVVLESLSCGTPVVAFDVGGIPDLIIHKKNGYLAKYRNAEDIAAGIDYVISNKVKGYVLPEMGKDEILNKHKSLINSILFKHQ